MGTRVVSAPPLSPQDAPHLELGLGDLAALLHVQGGEGVPDGLEQLLAQGHG